MSNGIKIGTQKIIMMKIINKIKRLYYHYKHNKRYQKALDRAVNNLSNKIDQDITMKLKNESNI